MASLLQREAVDRPERQQDANLEDDEERQARGVAEASRLPAAAAAAAA